jgi:low temperature requirement protein LtrA
VLAPLELFVPWWAERAATTPWHPHHIAERYGLLTLIVLGESVLATTLAIQAEVDAGHLTLRLGSVIVGSLLILFSIWWLYFDRPDHGVPRPSRAPFAWGYGHLFLFAAVAAVGTGLSLAVDVVTGKVHLPVHVSGGTIAVPVSVFLIAVWLLQVRRVHSRRKLSVAFLVTTALVLVSALSTWVVLLVGLLLAALVVASLVLVPAHEAER